MNTYQPPGLCLIRTLQVLYKPRQRKTFAGTESNGKTNKETGKCLESPLWCRSMNQTAPCKTVVEHLRKLAPTLTFRQLVNAILWSIPSSLEADPRNLEIVAFF